MIQNANILRIDAPGAADPGGNRSWSAGPAMVCRCLVTEPTQNDRYSLSAFEEQGSIALRVKMAELARASVIYGSQSQLAVEQRILIQDDKGQQMYYRVRQLVSQTHGSISMFVAALKKD